MKFNLICVYADSRPEILFPVGTQPTEIGRADREFPKRGGDLL